MSAIIQLQSICKTYNNGKSNAFLALQNIDISFETGKMYAVCGTSGAGKTTLLNIIGLADIATSGQYFLDGKNVESASDANCETGISAMCCRITRFWKRKRYMKMFRFL